MSRSKTPAGAIHGQLWRPSSMRRRISDEKSRAIVVGMPARRFRVWAGSLRWPSPPRSMIPIASDVRVTWAPI
jgi:hypothetical protein